MVGETGLRPGTVLNGRYRVRSRAGEGGLAEDLASGRPVALKLGRDPAPDRRPVRPPDHPNLARLLDSGKWGGRPYQVLEWVEGTDLGSYLRDHGPLDLPTACRLAAQVAAGLKALHGAGLVHGDVKPRNVLVVSGPGGPTVKLIDFGAGSQPGGPVLATPLYAAPEVLAGHHPTPAADAYGLGLLLFEPLTALGPPPEPARRVNLHPAEWNPAVPPGLEGLVARLTAPDPAHRPSNLGRIRAALEAYASPDASPTLPVGAATARLKPTQSPRAGRRLRAGVLAALVVALALLVGLKAAQQPAAPAPAGEAVQAAQVAPQAVRVPPVVRLPVGRAAEVLVGVGLRPVTIQGYSPLGPGLVVDQDPPAGTELVPGAGVTLTVSIGPPPAQADDDKRDRGRGKKRGRHD